MATVAKFKKEKQPCVYCAARGGSALHTLFPNPKVLQNQSGATFGDEAQGVVGQLAIDQAGAAAYILVSDSNGTMNWQSITQSASATPANLTVSNSATFSFLGTGVMMTNGAGQISSSTGTDGQLLIAGTALAPIWANLTSTDGTVVITNGPQSIDLSASPEGVVWSDKAISFNAAVNNGYRATATLVATLPASPSLGQVVALAQDAAAGTVISIVAGAGDVIYLDGVSSVAGKGFKTSALTSVGTGPIDQIGCYIEVVALSNAAWTVSSRNGNWIETT